MAGLLFGMAEAQTPGTAAVQTQTDPQTQTDRDARADSATQVYGAEYFRGLGLSNADDMLRRLPGVSAVLDAAAASTARGLGAGSDQVLVDGKRMASKADTVSALLRRIPAGAVERVELIRGTSGEVRSEGLVVNVVLKPETGAHGSGTAEARFRLNDSGWSDGDGLVSYSGGWRRWNYAVSLERNVWAPLGATPNAGTNDWSDRTRHEVYRYASGAILEDRPQTWRRDYQLNTLTGSLTYDFPAGGALRLNGLFQPNPAKQTDLTRLTRYTAAGAVSLRALEQHYNKVGKDTGELGAELERPLWGGTVNLIAVHSRVGTDQLDFRNRTALASGVTTELSRSASTQHTGEDVLRGSYAFALSKRQRLTFGAEAARNTLDQDIAAFFDSNGDGRLESIAIPTSHAEVAEDRGELFVTHNWKPTARLSIDSYATFEASRITTNYPAIPVRTLAYFKPRLENRYDLTPRDRLRGKIERTVSQLDFASFVPAYNIVDSRIDLGNPLINPATSWTYETALSHRLPNGTLEARAFLRDTTGGVSFVPFGVSSSGLPLSAKGNALPSQVKGLEGTASLKLATWGVPGAQIDARWLHQWSSAIDIFNLRPRKALAPWDNEMSLAFRQDLPRWGVTYGAAWLATNGDQLASDVRNYEWLKRGPRVDAYIEKTLRPGYSIRLEAYSLNGAEEHKRRALYSVSQADGAIARTETYDEARDRRFVVRLRGRF